jgi:hypothetical protein
MYHILLIFIIIFTLYILIHKKENYINYTDHTDPNLIRKVLDVDNYDAEKKRVSLTNIKKPRKYLRYFLDENRHNFINDIPFSPHIILNSYDDIDIAQIVSIKNTLGYINKLDRYEDDRFENKKEYCIRHKHKPECILAERKHRCFGKLEFSQKECEAENDLIGNRVNPGVWDRRCVANEDCPFYKVNINYPNSFGGCNNGYCEFPKGIERTGYRKYKKSSIPLCYNCSNKNGNLEIGNCCHLQKYPDYLFENDLPIRFKNKKILEQKGLSTVNHDNYDKEFRRLEKKLKI